MIGDHVYVFFTFFGPDPVEKEEDKKVNFRPRFSHFVYGGHNPHALFVRLSLSIHTS